jgi:hypothetical protein
MPAFFTDASGVDDASIAARSALLVDLRGVTRGMRVENLVRL